MKRLLYLFMLPLCLLAAMLLGSCGSDDGDGSVSLTDGMWRLEGFCNQQDNTFEAAEAHDGSDGYSLAFKADGTFSGHTCVNTFQGRYEAVDGSISLHDLTGTMVMERYDGDRFMAAVSKATMFRIEGGQLRLYYDGQHYLLFKK